MSWENSDTADVLWGARKLVLSVIDSMDVLMDVIDPIGCYRNGVDRYGEPLERVPDEYTTLDFLCEWSGRLRRANSALHEVALRESREVEHDAEQAHPADMPDKG